VGGVPWIRSKPMAVWRRRALELFPQLRGEITGRDCSVYSLFFELKPMLRAAFDAGDTDLLGRIFGFAEWCSSQTAKELWNPAGVAFYEHLFDYPQYSEQVIPWLSPHVVFTHWQLWEAMVAPTEWARVRPLLDGKRIAGEREAEAMRGGMG
jgi:hypothetical protein